MKSIHELTPEQAHAISEISTIETELGTQQKLKFESKRGAIELKMKRLGMLQPPKVENNTNNTLFLMTYEERLMRVLNRCGIERDPECIINKHQREKERSSNHGTTVTFRSVFSLSSVVEWTTRTS